MNDMNEVIKTAATVEEAIQLALDEMGLPREQVTAEVIEYPEKKFFFKKPAKVKVVKIEEEFDIRDLFRKEEKKEEKKQEKKQPVKEKPAKAAARQPKAPAQPRQEPQKAADDMEEIDLGQAGDKVKYAVEFLRGMIDRFYKQPYTVSVFKSHSGYVIKISGDDIGVLIGRKGETMEALSYLTGLAANRGEEGFEKISVDIADYRRKKEKDLVNSAKKAAAKVLKTGRPFGFEPMNPYDRRIIHAAISEIEGVKSESKGEGARRRVMVYSTNPRPRGPKGGKKPYGRGPRREKSAPQVQKTREEKLVDESNFGLYSKIEL